jgi:serine/threonine-protein kinase
MPPPLGKYRLLKLLATGGMAEVYLARQAGAAGFQKQVCLKRILPHLARDRQFVEMFLNEARVASQLDHPNIVSIFDLGESNGNYFIAMEFIDGPSLRAVALRAAELNELLPVAEVVRIVSQAAGGLHYAHELPGPDGQPLGLVHRDVSPDNLLVHRNGTVKIVDFGIAKAAGSTGNTGTGALKGKVAYMAPEQLRGEPVGRRADVFSLGVVLYELLAGHRPWDAPTEVALIARILNEEPQPLTEVREDALPALWSIVERALAKDPGQRHQTCQQLQADLEQYLVSLGQSATSSRLADFVRAYSPPPALMQEGPAAEAERRALQEQAFGAVSSPPVPGVPSRRAGLLQADFAGETRMAPPSAARNRRPRRTQQRSGLGGAVVFAVLMAAAAGLGWAAWQQKLPAPAQLLAALRARVAELRPAAAPPAATAQPVEPASPAQPGPPPEVAPATAVQQVGQPVPGTTPVPTPLAAGTQPVSPAADAGSPPEPLAAGAAPAPQTPAAAAAPAPQTPAAAAAPAPQTVAAGATPAPGASAAASAAPQPQSDAGSPAPKALPAEASPAAGSVAAAQAPESPPAGAARPSAEPVAHAAATADKADPPRKKPRRSREVDRLAALAQVVPSRRREAPAEAAATPRPPDSAPAVVQIPAISAKGELVLFVRPWAKVEVDGRPIGETPLADALELAAGDHQVRLINAELGKDVTRTVHIRASQRAVLKEILDD